MLFGRKESENDRLARERQEATVAALNGGGIPPIARERLELQRKYGVDFFTSDLSAKEYLLSREAGCKTLGQVMGTSFFRIGLASQIIRGLHNSHELEELSHANTMSRQYAMRRMLTEARLLGASGVVAVRIESNSHSWAQGTVEFTAFGTAVVVPGYPEGADPFTSALSLQEFWSLHQTGYWPCGLVFGISSYYAAADPWTQRLLEPGNDFLSQKGNQEITQFTEGIYRARHIAVDRLKREAQYVGGQGTVGMTVSCTMHEIEFESKAGGETDLDMKYHNLLVNFVALGTAIRKYSNRPAPRRALLMYDLARKTNRNVEYEM